LTRINPGRPRVVTVRAAAAPISGDPMKILVAVDGSSFTKRMLGYLAAHDEWLGSTHQYTMITVVPAIPPRAKAVLDAELVKEYYADEGEKVFKPIRAFFARHGITARYLARTGPAGDLIAKEATTGRYDLLMMGSHGHSTLGSLIMGSVASRTLSQCKTPVLIVR
jgi:nucleotide-binding universal stress UspA family protein